MVWKQLLIFISSVWVTTNSFQYFNAPSTESSFWNYFSSPYSHQTEMETMVDLTNKFGVTILQDHSRSKGNFAFSPYGLASVLVILYEGARNESAIQIQRAFGFPPDKDIIRVGFRDLHRHLRSYFSHEGYLSGISLNKEDSSLKPEFKKIVKLYGYDVDTNENQDGSSSTQKATTTAPTSAIATSTSVVDTTTKVKNQTSTEADSQETSETTIPPTTLPTTSPTTPPTAPPTTAPTAPPTTTTTAPPTTPPTTAPTTPPTTLPTTPPTAPPTTLPTTPPTAPPTTPPTTPPTAPPTTPPTTPPTIPPTFPPTTPPTSPTTPPTTTPTTPPTSPTIPPTVPPTTPPETTTETFTTSEITLPIQLLEYSTQPEKESTTETVLSTFQPTEPVTIIDDEVELTLSIDECRKRAELSGTEDNCLRDITERKANQRKTHKNDQSNHDLKTKKREQASDEIQKLDNKMLIPQESDLATIKTSTQKRKARSPHKTNHIGSIVKAKNEITMSRKLDEEETSNKRFLLWLDPKPLKPQQRNPRTITDYLKWPQTSDLSFELQNGMYDSHVSMNAQYNENLPRLLFLIDGAIDTPVPMMIYTYVFPFAYIPRLHARALEFPLDDPRYKLLILLPVERRGLRQLINDLMGYSLRDVLDLMKPMRVKVTIPTFMVDGFVILTSSLQKLGILDVFDPCKANLSGMSMDPKLYVRNVEQSVTVVIRNYVETLDILTRTMAARYMEYDFQATHPFLYFVLDTATNVALMAGQMLDPLSSRIY